MSWKCAWLRHGLEVRVASAWVGNAPLFLMGGLRGGVIGGHLGRVLADAQAPGLQAPDSVGLARKSQAEGFACGGKGGRGPWR